ncbi:glycosyltransferase family 2 protein [Empedobacter falsenii]
MKILIILVTYNGEKWLDKCIKTLYDIENVDFFVVDNNSKDDTVSHIKSKFPQVHLIESNFNLGFGQANNLGFEYAIKNNYDFVFLLNQDASIDLENLSRLVTDYKNDSTIGILSPVHYQEETQIENLFKFYLKDSSIDEVNVGQDKIVEAKFVNAALWLISIENLIKIGGFNPLYFHYGEDVDYVNRVKYNNLLIKISLAAKGYHYRNYSKENFKKSFKKNRFFGPWNIKYYTILSNVNISFLMVFISSAKLFAINFVKYLSKGYFHSAYMCLKVYLNILKETKKIINNREVIKRTNAPFLNLKN